MNDPILQSEFIKGTAEVGLEGFYKGELTRLFPNSLGETFGSLLLNIWLPWNGKFFYPNEQLGDNILSQSLQLVVQFLFRDFDIEKPLDHKFHAFPFKTYVMPGILDQINVLQLHYDIPQNPPFVRKITDEIVKVGPNSYLGKAYLINNNLPRLIAYFRLKKI